VLWLQKNVCGGSSLTSSIIYSFRKGSEANEKRTVLARTSIRGGEKKYKKAHVVFGQPQLGWEGKTSYNLSRRGGRKKIDHEKK